MPKKYEPDHWYCCPSRESAGYVVSSRRLLPEQVDREVAEVRPTPGDDPAADVRVIVASPNLLRALQGLVAETKQHCGKLNVRKHFGLMNALAWAEKVIRSTEKAD